MKKSGLLICQSLLLGAASCGFCPGAQAAITCSVSSNGWSTSYAASNPATNVTAASVTMTCTRNATGDANSQAYDIKVNNGLTPAGQTNQAASGANRITYDNYLNSACTNKWKANTILSGTITLGAVGVSSSQTLPFWGCVPAAQLGIVAGIYVDTVTLLPSIGAPATFPVTISTASSCTISSPIQSLNFNYASFQTLPATAATSFSATCTGSVPYTLALDATSGVLAGVAYTLSLSAASAVGNGVAQPFTITGSMAAGQTGNCATGVCTATQPRTLTITY